MAKPLGPKSILIREAITANPGKTPKSLRSCSMTPMSAWTTKLGIHAEDDISQQKQAMKKGGTVPAPAAAPCCASRMTATKPAGNT